MRVSQIILRVSNLERSTQFWSEVVGFDLSMQSGDFAFLDGGSLQLTLHRLDTVPADDSLTEIVIEVDDVTVSYRELSERGVTFPIEPRAVTSDGQRELWATHFHDPDGHLASIVSWVE